MPQKSIPNTPSFALKIKNRRQELSLTIEEAAQRAGVGTKTWCRYEAGEAIRADKYKGICKALNWPVSTQEDRKADDLPPTDDYKNHEAWSNYLEDAFGYKAALAFAVGSDILLDHIKEDLAELASRPKGTHIGQLPISFLADSLPPQFLTDYDYDFIYHIKCVLQELRYRAKNGNELLAHSIIEELLIYLCNEEADILVEFDEWDNNTEEDNLETTEDWVFDLFGDSDMLMFLYSYFYQPVEYPFHISHWFEQQFYMD